MTVIISGNLHSQYSFYSLKRTGGSAYGGTRFRTIMTWAKDALKDVYPRFALNNHNLICCGLLCKKNYEPVNDSFFQNSNFQEIWSLQNIPEICKTLHMIFKSLKIIQKCVDTTHPSLFL